MGNNQTSSQLQTVIEAFKQLSYEDMMLMRNQIYTIINKKDEETRKQRQDEANKAYLERRNKAQEARLKKKQEIDPYLLEFGRNYVCIGDVLTFTGASSDKKVTQINDCSIFSMCGSMTNKGFVSNGYGSDNVMTGITSYRGEHGILKTKKDIINFIKNKQSEQSESVLR